LMKVIALRNGIYIFIYYTHYNIHIFFRYKKPIYVRNQMLEL